MTKNCLYSVRESFSLKAYVEIIIYQHQWIYHTLITQQTGMYCIQGTKYLFYNLLIGWEIEIWIELDKTIWDVVEDDFFVEIGQKNSQATFLGYQNSLLIL